MKKIVSVALLSLVTGVTTILFIQTAQADGVIYCTPDTHTNVLKDPADHPDAYADGYREGEQSARLREAYRPRTAGGEFARGFDDGYYNRRYSGQQYVVPTRIEQYTTQNCNDAYETDYGREHYGREHYGREHYGREDDEWEHRGRW